MSTERSNIESIEKSDQRDSEDELNILLTVLEQYHDNYNHLETKEEPDFKKLEPLLENEDLTHIQMAFEQMSSLRKMLNQIFEKGLAILPEITKDVSELKNKYHNLEEQLEDTNLILQNLKEKKKEDEAHLAEINMLYERAKNDNALLVEKIAQKEQEFENESSLIRKRFLEVSESSESEKKLLESLSKANEKLTEELESVKELETKIDELQKNVKIDYDEVDVDEENVDDYYVRSSFNETIHERKEDQVKLGEELHNYNPPTIKELNGSFIMGAGIKRGPVEGDYIEYYDNPSMSYQKPQVQTHESSTQTPESTPKPQKESETQTTPSELSSTPTQTTPPLTTESPSQTLAPEAPSTAETPCQTLSPISSPVPSPEEPSPLPEDPSPVPEEPSPETLTEGPETQETSSQTFGQEGVQEGVQVSMDKEIEKVSMHVQTLQEVYQVEGSVQTETEAEEKLDKDIAHEEVAPLTPSKTKQSDKGAPLDPYFWHYALLVQAVKIKEDCEKALAIDMRPYYVQVVSDRVPMHLWEEWIRKRIREIVKNGH